MKHSIIEKLNKHISVGIKKEADVVYLLVEIGKFLEQTTDKDYPTIKFYRNWVVHSKINDLRSAGKISRELNSTIASLQFGPNEEQKRIIKKISKIISLNNLYSELKKFFNKNDLINSASLLDRQWNLFIKLLVSILADVPLVFPISNSISEFYFTDVRLRAWPINQIATWVIKSPKGTFQGPISVKFDF